MDKKDYEVKAWGGVKGRVVGKCKYCKAFSFAEVMRIDPIDKKAYHEGCKTKHDREIADNTQNL